MLINLLFFIYGLSVMFFGMMALMFWRRSGDRLSRLVTLLMCTLTVQCLVTCCFLGDYWDLPRNLWNIVTGIDVVVIPMYAFILMELCRPGSLTRGQMLWHELPFVALILALIIIDNKVIYNILVGYSAIYGCYYFIWTWINIPKYHKHLKERFSYVENINLNWLRFILLSFFLILGLWLLCSLTLFIGTEIVYMLSSDTVPKSVSDTGLK